MGFSLVWPFSPDAEIPIDGLCIEYGFRRADEDDGEGQEVVVFGEHGAILEKVNFG